MSTIYQDEARRIGDQLRESAIRDVHGLTWETMRLDSAGTAKWATSTDLYEGTSGIALFFIALYRSTKDDVYLETAKAAMDWVDWHAATAEQHDRSAGFLTGQLGVTFVFLKLYEATDNKQYLAKARLVAKKYSPAQANGLACSDYTNGIAGSLLVLLHLHSVAPERWLTERIEAYTLHLLERARYLDGGMAWDRVHHKMKPLCGFAHGAAGIGFVFLELGHYFNNSALYTVAEQAFAYEDSHFNTKLNNWPDFRVKMYTDAQFQNAEDAYIQGVRSTPPQAKDIFVWCHGAAGIGMSRMRAHKLLGRPEDMQDIQRARKKTRLVKKYPFTLCHGHAGNAELFIGTPRATHIAKMALRHHQALGRYCDGYATGSKREDPGFMNGIAGIGYFMLRVHDPQQTPSILAPTVGVRSGVSSSLRPATIGSSILHGSFPRTLAMLAATTQGPALEAYCADNTTAGAASFVRFVQSLHAALPPDHLSAITDVCNLEMIKVQFDAAIENQALMHIEDRLRRRDAPRLAQSNLLHSSERFVLSPRCKLIASQSYGAVLLKQTPTGVTETQVSMLCSVVLSSFTEETSVSDAMSVIVSTISGTSAIADRHISRTVIDQIRQAIEHMIIVTPEVS